MTVGFPSPAQGSSVDDGCLSFSVMKGIDFLYKVLYYGIRTIMLRVGCICSGSSRKRRAILLDNPGPHFCAREVDENERTDF